MWSKINILILSCGTRVKLVEYFKQAESGFENVIVTDCSEYAPALYIADKYYIVPKMTEANYMDEIVNICKLEKVGAVLPLQEEELLLMAEHKSMFESMNILLAASEYQTVALCKDKYKLYQVLNEVRIPTIKTQLVCDWLKNKQSVSREMFVKPRMGAGSVGAMRVKTRAFLEALKGENPDQLIVQPYIRGKEYGVDVYVDFISGQITALFCKEKIRMRAGETEKSVSVKVPEIKELIIKVVHNLQLKGALDIDVLEENGKYYILEINPRFGGGYPHAYECGIDFPKMIAQNAANHANVALEDKYETGVIALKYSDVLICKDEK